MLLHGHLEDLGFRFGFGALFTFTTIHAAWSSVHARLFTETAPLGLAIPDPAIVQQWGAVVVMGSLMLWQEIRKARRASREDYRSDEALSAIHKLNMHALKKGEPAPYPQFLPQPEKPK